MMTAKLLSPSAPFEAVRDGQFTMPRFVDIDLSSERTELTALEINIAGNVLYCDANPGDGNCIVEFNDVGRDSGTDTPFYVSPGFIGNVPFTRIRVYNSAQPGRKVRLVYGVDIPFQPGSVAQVAIAPQGVNGAYTQTQRTVTNASAEMIPANTARRYLLIQNKDTSGDIWVNLTGVAATSANGILILAGGSLELQGFVCTGAIHAIGSIASNANIVSVEG